MFGDGRSVGPQSLLGRIFLQGALARTFNVLGATFKEAGVKGCT